MTTEQFIGLEEFEEKIDKLDTERDGSHPWLEAEWVTGLIFMFLFYSLEIDQVAY